MRLLARAGVFGPNSLQLSAVSRIEWRSGSESDTYGSVRLRLTSTILKQGAVSFLAVPSWELSYWRSGRWFVRRIHLSLLEAGGGSVTTLLPAAR